MFASSSMMAREVKPSVSVSVLGWSSGGWTGNLSDVRSFAGMSWRIARQQVTGG